MSNTKIKLGKYRYTNDYLSNTKKNFITSLWYFFVDSRNILI